LGFGSLLCVVEERVTLGNLICNGLSILLSLLLLDCNEFDDDEGEDEKEVERGNLICSGFSLVVVLLLLVAVDSEEVGNLIWRGLSLFVVVDCNEFEEVEGEEDENEEEVGNLI
jgi:hypothetical protein